MTLIFDASKIKLSNPNETERHEAGANLDPGDRRCDCQAGQPTTFLDSARELSLCFQRLANFDGIVLERLGRYESALARQIVQVMFVLQTARRRRVF
jgi:hypothetical protein